MAPHNKKQNAKSKNLFKNKTDVEKSKSKKHADILDGEDGRGEAAAADAGQGGGQDKGSEGERVPERMAGQRAVAAAAQGRDGAGVGADAASGAGREHVAMGGDRQVGSQAEADTAGRGQADDGQESVLGA